jgi:hypothetical protein
MGLTDLFNQWIVERGSAVVQEKHIALFRDQLIAADKQISILTTENNNLKSLIEQLTKNNKILRQEIQRRDDIIQKEKSHDNLLDETKIKILILLSKQEYLTAEHISSFLNINPQIAKFHISELDSLKMIDCLMTIGESNQWYLLQEGRKYLIENKLIS